MAKGDEITGEGDFECDKCGRKFKHGAWYTKHAKDCRGPVATSGRIAARDGATTRAVAVVSRKRSAAPRRQKRERAVTARLVTPGVGAIATAATDKAIEVVLAGLRERRDRITSAIATLEALGT